MRRLMAILTLTVFSCSPQYQLLTGKLDRPINLVIPYEEAFQEWEPYMNCFAQEDGMLQDERPRIILTGSSSIRMWGTMTEDLAELPYLVLNRGFGGSTLPEVNYYFEHLIVPHDPEAIVLYCGENDITDGMTAEDVYNSFGLFLRLTRHYTPDAKLIFMSMKPSPSRWKLWPEFDRGNEMVRSFIESLEDPMIRYLDVGAPMLLADSGRPDPAIFIEDSLHMNDLGYDRWEPLVYNELKRVLDYKDDEDRAAAGKIVDRIFEDQQFSTALADTLDAVIQDFAHALPEVTPTVWEAFSQQRVQPNLAKIELHVREALIDSLSMLEWQELDQQLYRIAGRPDASYLAHFNEKTYSVLTPILYELTRELSKELEGRNIIASAATPEACRRFQEGSFYTSFGAGRDTVQVHRSEETQQVRLGQMQTDYRIVWLDDCSFELRPMTPLATSEASTAPIQVEIMQTNEERYLCKRTLVDEHGERVRLDWMEVMDD